jgi:hypothetical protein
VHADPNTKKPILQAAIVFTTSPPPPQRCSLYVQLCGYCDIKNKKNEAFPRRKSFLPSSPQSHAQHEHYVPDRRDPSKAAMAAPLVARPASIPTSISRPPSSAKNQRTQHSAFNISGTSRNQTLEPRFSLQDLLQRCPSRTWIVCCPTPLRSFHPNIKPAQTKTAAWLPSNANHALEYAVCVVTTGFHSVSCPSGGCAQPHSLHI